MDFVERRGVSMPDTVKRWEIRYRDEFRFDQTDDFLPSDLRWSHCGNNSDIIAYRVWEWDVNEKYV